MVTAMIGAVAEKGYVATTVGDVLTRAGVSRATFYEQFVDKADCFRATYESVTGLLAQVMETTLTSLTTDGKPSDPVERINSLIGSYLDLLAQSPDLAKVFLVEVYATGPAVIAQRRATVDSFIDLIVSLLGDTPPGSTRDERRFAVRALVAALVGLATEAAAAGDITRIGELRQPFETLVAGLLDGPRPEPRAS